MINFCRTITRAKSIAYKKSKSLDKHYIPNGKPDEDESHDLVSKIG